MCNDKAMLVSMKHAENLLTVVMAREDLGWGLARFGRSGARVTWDAAKAQAPQDRELGPA